VFPRSDKKEDEIEEERRLFYVGATRAMDELYFTSCALRRVFGQTSPMEPSLFLSEVDKSALRIIGKAPHGFLPAYTPKQGAPTQRVDTRRGIAWAIGDRLFNDDNGYGSVIALREYAGNQVLLIRFDNGKELSFLNRPNTKITRVTNDVF
jgi:DNA helicase-2/ATP-dependent DNA helicase PcrA